MRHILQALPIFALMACGHQEPARYVLTEEDARAFAEHRCRASIACCGAASDAAACVDALTEKMMGYGDLTDAKLTYSQGCMRAVVAWAPQIDCRSAAELDAPGCRLAHGDRSRGEACIAFGDVGFFGTDCGTSLQCLAGHCVDDPFIATQRAREGERCNAYTRCDLELFCDVSGICRKRAEPGEPCSEPNECGAVADYYCRGFATGAGECVPKSGLGEPCDPLELACAFACNPDGACELLDCIGGVCSPRGPAVCDLP
jgi:hypothetical protein